MLIVEMLNPLALRRAKQPITLKLLSTGTGKLTTQTVKIKADQTTPEGVT